MMTIASLSMDGQTVEFESSIRFNVPLDISGYSGNEADKQMSDI